MEIILHIAELVLVVFLLYLFWPLLLFSFFYTRIRNRISLKSNQLETKHEFQLIIPAHNEEMYIANLLKSIQNCEYDKSKIHTLVVVDNCTDNTLQIVRNNNFSFVEKKNLDGSTKSKALSFGFNWLERNNKLNEDSFIIILDADCIIDKMYFLELSHEINKSNKKVYQTFRKVHNLNDSAVAALDAGAESIRQWLDLGVRDCLGLNARIHGSGLVFDLKVFKELLHLENENITEDKLWNISLVQKDVDINWVPNAHISYFATEKRDSFYQQRSRWISGQIEMAKKFGFKLTYKGLINFNLNQFDLGFSLLLMPRSFLFMITFIFTFVNYLFPAYFFLPGLIYVVFLLLFFVLGITGLVISGSRIHMNEILATAFRLILNVFSSTIKYIFGRSISSWGKSR